MARPEKIRKRDGRIDVFDVSRIEAAIARAALETGSRDQDLAGRAAARVVDDLSTRFRRVPSIEDVQDAVERALMGLGHEDVARAYVLYRERRTELREAKRTLGVEDDLKLTLNAAVVLRDRYLLKDEGGNPVESTGELMERVARHIGAAEDEFSPGASGRWTEEFARALKSLEFLPNSPTLMNAGTSLGLLSGCFVLPVEDSLDSIFDALKSTALIHQAGGGTGFSFSRLRPAGDVVGSTHGVASGPVSFMRVFDTATDVIKQGGRRRGANMAVLHVSHPDVRDFITVKSRPGVLENFNLSVAVTDHFMRAVERDSEFSLVNPRTGKSTGGVAARQLFDQVSAQAWGSGDPGLLFIDRVNRTNPVPSLGRIEATNPCGEVPLLPWESCNLGSINVARFVSGERIDWERLDDAIALGIRFLDNVIEVNRYPHPALDEAARRTRKVGLGFMGLAEGLASLGIPYDSDEAVRLARRIASRISRTARHTSAGLAEERGAFPEYERSVFARKGTPLRNAQLTSVAPTGTISIIAGTTSGIEPMFALSYVRNVLGGRNLIEVNPTFELTARRRGFYSEALMAEVARAGGVRSNRAVPEDVRRAFVTALEIEPGRHLDMQAAVQRHVDAAVSKTINLPETATVEDVKRTYLAAWKAGLKGITIYRYGSKPDQVLNFLSGNGEGEPPVQADSIYAGGCAGYVCEF